MNVLNQKRDSPKWTMDPKALELSFFLRVCLDGEI